MGHVLQAGAGQITSLQASIGAGLPKDVPAITINKVCLSGMSAIAMADQMIRAGEIEVAVAGGMESMTNAPYLLPKGREGARLGDAELIDSMIHDGLWSSFLDQHMGEGTDEVSAELGLTREEQDAWAARSHHAGPRRLGDGTDGGGGRRRSRSRSAGACPVASIATKGSAPTRRRRPSRDCGRRSGPTGRSRRGTPRRSPTAPPPSW